MNERRKDIGSKMIFAITGGIITLLLSLFFNHTYNMSNEAHGIATAATKDVAVLSQCINEINRRLGSMDSKLDKLVNR